ncbi:protein Aster-B isoform X2 [Onthophagus taurus]|uniref:protein Aster-B isoform X2 n=1 Tax=Onthophagus taurus TaxID=166361 RepID=UPI000C20C6AD|nr:GRAM domain-containing protein 1B-like [Onthophagus taurus]
MKMTLNAQGITGDRQSGSPSDTKSGSPGSSPRSSPRPSPKPQTKREHSRIDTHLGVSRDPSSSSVKFDVSPGVTPDSCGPFRIPGNELVLPPELNRTESTSSSKDRKDTRTKKKSAWYNVLYPTYKSRSEDYKRIFKEVPDDERLVVDYSCALQKEILVHGRLYVSQNYLCFYANIFGWETNVTIKWKDVSAITKEKTALVIPNAILIMVKSEKFFFTSFVARDKTYLMLFRVWQNALLDQPMAMQEMWQWVHQCYGDELGLTSDDEDYIAPGTEEEKLSGRLSVESFSEECGSNGDVMLDQLTPEDKDVNEVINEEEGAVNNNHTAMPPTDLSESSDSDGEKVENPVCTALHEGKQLINEVYSMHVDQLFTLLFTSSKFFLDFHASRKTSDFTQTAWSHNPNNNMKTRTINLTIPLTQAIGPKSAQVTETQVMLTCSKPGYLYAIDVDIVNGGIPYADSFYCFVHYCLHKISDTQSSMAVYAQIKYKKNVWGLVKGMIEKNSWQGVEDFFSALAKALHIEAEESTNLTEKHRSGRRRRPIIQRPIPKEMIRPVRSSIPNINTIGGVTQGSRIDPMKIVFSVLIMLAILTGVLYYKLWTLEGAIPSTFIDLHVLKDPPTTHEEWVKLLQQQETLHTVEMHKWQKILKTAIQLLRDIEESLSQLQRSIHPAYTSKIMSMVQNQDGSKSSNNDEL